MRYFTHLSAGFFVGFILFKFHPSPEIITLAMLGSLLPDIDLPFSKLGKMPFFLRFIIKHRGVTHSILFGILTAIITGFLLEWWAGLAMLVGVFSHLIVDGLNPSGVPVLWPLPMRLKGNVKYALYNDLIISGILLIVTGLLWVFW